MAVQSIGLGRGLDALIRETQDAQEGSGARMLLLRDIRPNPRQPRRTFSEKTLEELAASIRSQGLLQPLLVRPVGKGEPGKYEIVAGERRWRASQMAGLEEVPALVRSFSAQDTLAAALIENIQREDLNPIEEAQGLQILKEEFGLSQDDLAHKIGKSRSAVANSLRLLSLPDSIRPLVAEGRLSAGHARALLSIGKTEAQEHLKNLIIESKLSVREAEGLASGWKETGSFNMPGVCPPEADGRSASAAGREQAAQALTDDAAKRAAARESKSRPQSARILDIQSRIGSLYKVPVRVTGKESRGKISFSYTTKEELDWLLEQLTRFALEGEDRLALGSADLRALGANERAALPGNNQHPLEGRKMESLQGAELPALEGHKQQVLGAAATREALGAGAQPEADSSIADSAPETEA